MLYAKFYYIMRSKICYIIDWGFHIEAMGLITTRGLVIVIDKLISMF